VESTGASVPAEQTTDEEAARVAREQYREAGLPLIDADATISAYLGQGEHVIGWRERATLARVVETGHAPVQEEGSLYITDRRLVHLGQEVMSIALEDVRELAMADDRILITLAGARGVMLDVPSPRQLRVLIAAARSQLRA
jgi:hypothetical protein